MNPWFFCMKVNTERSAIIEPRFKSFGNSTTLGRHTQGCCVSSYLKSGSLLIGTRTFCFKGKSLCTSIHSGRIMSAAEVPRSAKAKKRKQRDDGGSRKRRKGDAFVDDSLLDTEAGVNRSFETMDSQLLSDHFSQQTTRFGTDLSPIELSDLYISSESIYLGRNHVICTRTNQDRCGRELDQGYLVLLQNQES